MMFDSYKVNKLNSFAKIEINKKCGPDEWGIDSFHKIITSLKYF